MSKNDYTEAEVRQAMENIPSYFIELHKIKNESGVEIEFTDHYFMRDIYDDLSPLQVTLKAPQVGETTKAIFKTLWVAHKMKKDIIYTLPTQSDIQEMAGGKVNRMIAQNPILKTWVKDHDTVEQKAVGNNIIYYRGTFTNKAAMMVASSLNVHDEVDASNQQVLTQYETRLQAQADGWRWYFSHPSLVDYGVDVYWQQSDKKEWFVTCTQCHVKQQLKFPDNIDFDKKCYKCSICSTELSDDTRRYGEWIATSKGMYSGYHISQLMCAWIPASKIIDDFNNKPKDYFYNYVLGLPFAGAENKISKAQVLANCIPRVNDQSGQIIIGVDSGLPIHYVIGNEQGIFYYGTCKSWRAIEQLMLNWKQSIVIADQGGDLIGVRELQEKYNGRVFLVYSNTSITEGIKWNDVRPGEVNIDRNKMVQYAVDHLRERRIPLFGSKEDWLPYAEHFSNIIRKDEETASMIMRRVWTRNGPDHWVFGTVYYFVGISRFNGEKGGFVGREEEGYKFLKGYVGDEGMAAFL